MNIETAKIRIEGLEQRDRANNKKISSLKKQIEDLHLRIDDVQGFFCDEIGKIKRGEIS